MIQILRERHGEEDVTVITQDALVSTFSQILGALTLALGAIAAISLTVAGIGIMNVMLVSVSERTREVGLLRALGVRRRQVLTVFLAESVLLSAAGDLIGLAAGWPESDGDPGMRDLIRLAVPGLPVHTPLLFVALAVGVSVGTGLISGLLPARRAARLDPIEALRAE